MALTDQKIQDLQEKVLPWLALEKGSTQTVTGQEYKIIHTENGATQAIAVAPVNNGKTDYSQTTIVVAGTIPINERQDLDALTSGARAVRAMGGYDRSIPRNQ